MTLQSESAEADRISFVKKASRLFHDFRYDELSVDMIHHKMSLSRDDFEELFESKDLLFREVLKYNVANEKDAPWLELRRNSDIKVALRMFLERCKADLMNEAVLGNLVLETATSGSNGSFIAGSAIETAKNLVCALISERFEEAHRLGQLSGRLSTEQRVVLIYSTLRLMKIYSKTPLGEAVMSTAIDSAIAGSCS